MHKRMKSGRHGWIGLVLLVYSASALPQPNRISLDGLGSDWQNIAPRYTDSIADQVSGNLDFRRLWITHDEQSLLLRIEVAAEINLQEQNSIVMYLDTDDNPATGKSIHGLGVDLIWQFGNRAGVFFTDKKQVDISHPAIGLVTAPTVSASDFEIALARNAQPVPGVPLFPGKHIRIIFEDQGVGRDRLPDSDAAVAFAFSSADSLHPLISLSPGRLEPDQVRFLSYNVRRDNLFDREALPRFQRILRAIRPDVIGFQEIYNHTAEQTVRQIETILPLTGHQRWQSRKIGPDLVAVSRFPIIQSYSIPGSDLMRASGAFLLDLSPAWPSRLLFIVAHPPCCSNNTGRQYEIDAIMAFIRSAQSEIGELQLPPLTPILIVGDMNLVGSAQQLKTLLTGEIINQSRFGSSFHPDWDGTNFADLCPRQINSPMYFTWYEPGSSFSPGRLDFMIFSDSVLKPGNHFVLFTPNLASDTLSKYQIQPEDAVLASDHLPVVGDFFLTATGKAHNPYHAPAAFILVGNYPNPFTRTTAIRYDMQLTARVQMMIVNLRGQEIRKLVDSTQAIGSYLTTWDGKDDQGRKVSPGVYFCRLRSDAYTVVKKLLYLRS